MQVVPGGEGVELYSPLSLFTPPANITVSLVSADGEEEIASETHTYLSQHIALFGDSSWINKTDLLAAMPYNGRLFRIKLTKVGVGSNQIRYSNILILDENRDHELRLLRYRCAEAFNGFPFANDEWVSMWVPIWLNRMQYRQSDETYTRLDGSVAVLYATRTKEYEAHTDYIPESWHDKILAALMCDEVTLDGQLYQKSADYSIEWDNILTIHDHKCTRATFKMIERRLDRNSNTQE